MSSDSVFLSIIVLCYNVGEYIDRCLRSLSEQEFEDFEVIVVDDASTDDCGSRADAFAQKDKRIRVFHKEHGNIVAARKYGILKAKGKYIASVDGDDWIEADMYAKMCKSAKDTYADVVQCSMFRNARTYITAGPHPQETGLYAGEEYRKQLLAAPSEYDSHIIQNSLCSKMIKKELLISAIEGMDDDCVLGEDAVCSVICAGLAKRHYQIKECLYHYRLREGSRTNSTEDDMLERLQKLSAFGKKKVREIEPALTEQIDIRIRMFIIMTLVQEMAGGKISDERRAYWSRMLKTPELQSAMNAGLSRKESSLLMRFIYGRLKRGKLPPRFMMKEKR